MITAFYDVILFYRALGVPNFIACMFICIGKLLIQHNSISRQTAASSKTVLTFPFLCFTLSEAWSGVNWADLMAAQSAFGTDYFDRSIPER